MIIVAKMKLEEKYEDTITSCVITSVHTIFQFLFILENLYKMAAEEEIAKIVDHFSKEDNQKIQEFEKSSDYYKKLVEAGMATHRGYCIISSDQLYTCPENYQIKY